MDEQSLFLQALEQPAGETRRRWLVQACGDEAVRARVANLVERHEQAGNFLERPAVEMLESADDAGSPATDENQSDSHSESKSEKRITKEKFVDRLIRSKLMTVEEVAECESTVGSLRSAADAQSYAQAMVRAKKLTRFQARAIYDGRIKGLTFGEYVILDQLGKGGMGIVYKAQHRRMERLVAIKVLPRFAMATNGAVNRFYREVKAAAKLMHPNIVAALDAGEDEGLHYLVMEFVDGHDLGEILRRRGPLPADKAIDYVIQAARGLQFAHEQGVIHRDIKPANLLIDRNGAVKILDMGLARVTDAADNTEQRNHSRDIAVASEAIAEATTQGFAETVSLERETARVNQETRLTKAGEVMGTLDYMPPEQFTNTRAVDERGDIYSLGCTLYRLLTNERPFPVDTVGAIYAAHHRTPPPALRSVRPDIPEPLDAVFQKMLAKEPDQRQASMGQLIEELEAVIRRGQRLSEARGEQLPGQSLRDDTQAMPGFADSSLPQPRDPLRLRRRKRNPWITAAIAACVLLTVGALTLVLKWTSNQENLQASNKPVASADPPGDSSEPETQPKRNVVNPSPPAGEPTPPPPQSEAIHNQQPQSTRDAATQPSNDRVLEANTASATDVPTDQGDDGSRGKSGDSSPAVLAREDGGRSSDSGDVDSGDGNVNMSGGGIPGGPNFGGEFSFGGFGNRNMTFFDNGRKVSLNENAKGITLSIDGRVITAADAEDLKSKDREAYALYEKLFGRSSFGSFKAPFGGSASDLQIKQLEKLRDQNSNNPQMKAMFEKMLRDAKQSSKKP